MDNFTLSTIEEGLEELAKGNVIIVVDNEDRENEGDFVVAAEKVTPQAINFMATHGRGLICQPITEERAAELELPRMIVDNTCPHGTAFTVSVDVREGTTTGISAFDRAKTINAMISSDTKPGDFIRPGHMFPLIAHSGGIEARQGHTEAAVELARDAGLYPSGVICEILNEDGTMARIPQLIEVAKKHNLKMISIDHFVEWKKKKNNNLSKQAETTLPTEFGNFTMAVYEKKGEVQSPFTLTAGEIDTSKEVLLRIHSECLTGDILGSRKCDCGTQLHYAMKRVQEESGLVIYLRQEGRGIGLVEKIKAYNLQNDGLDTVDANLALGHGADLRDYSDAADILRELGIAKVRLLTNNPLKIEALKNEGFEVSHEAALGAVHDDNIQYLETKKNRMGHTIEFLKSNSMAG